MLDVDTVAPQVTDEPFGVALSRLIRERGLSRRRLAQLTPAVDGRGLAHSYLGQLTTGDKQPTRANMVLIAACFDLDPSFFAEYRALLVAERAASLAAQHGSQAVLDKLSELDGA